MLPCSFLAHVVRNPQRVHEYSDASSLGGLTMGLSVLLHFLGSLRSSRD